MDIKNGHNFLSREKFVRNVCSDVSKTAISIEPTGSVIYWIVSNLYLYSIANSYSRAIISAFATSNPLYASLCILCSPLQQTPEPVHIPDVPRTTCDAEDMLSYSQRPCNRTDNPVPNGNLHCHAATVVGPLAPTSCSDMYNQT